MRKSYITLIMTGLCIMGCSHYNTRAESPSGRFPKEFQSVVDSVRELVEKDSSLNAEYFLYDITGDGIPELWVKSGSCEADTKLSVFTNCKGNTKKIYDGGGGHSDYFIFNHQLVCVMCNTGTGIVITYEYDGKQVVDSGVEFSTWNGDGKALSEPHDSVADSKLRYWEDNYDNYIELKPL